MGNEEIECITLFVCGVSIMKFKIGGWQYIEKRFRMIGW